LHVEPCRHENAYRFMKGGRALLPVWGKWLIVAVGCGIAEIFTPNFFILWFGAGALVAAVISALGLGVVWQFTGFILASAVLILYTKRISSRWFTKREETKTNIYGLPGKTGYVTRDISEGCPGEVRVGGETWTARSALGARIRTGAKVEVVKVQGVHLVVRGLDESANCE
jgi:membrane protein implicated in regulation of membrane protease activity